MKVGVSCHFQFSFFSQGSGQTSIAIAETLKAHGFSVSLVGVGPSEWWDDVKTLKNNYDVRMLDSIKEPEFDLFIDIEGVQTAETRARIAKKSVMLWRKSPILMDMEPTIYPVNAPKRNFEGLSAIWTYDHFETSDIQYIQLLSKLPVFRVPFVWSPLAVDHHRKEIGFPEWMQTIDLMKDVRAWDCHICETNMSCTSSSTIPIVAISHAKKHTQFPISILQVHSAEHIKGNEFFNKNVLEHTQVDGLTVNFIGRQRCCDWTIHCRGWVMSHLRFMPIKPYLLDLAWSGIPTVHNSIWLRDIDPVFADFYYPDNSLTKATEAMNKMLASFEAKTGMFAEGYLPKIRQQIFRWVATRMSSSAWSVAVNGSVSSVGSSSVEPSFSIQVPKKEVVSNTVNTVNTVNTMNTIKILFTDMWADFNPAYNFFTLLLTESSKNITPKIVIEGHSKETLKDEKPSLLVFGPFGNTWKNYHGIPKVHFTGENTPSINHEDVKLNLTYENVSGNDDKKIRLPLWMLEIDWFGANLDKIVNPKPLPLDTICKPTNYPKSKFCAFVVTNPCNQVRNDAFAWLSMYKKVDSAGRLFNNVGDVIFAGLGGGGGELKKHNFLKDYKFCFAYENSSASGYTTEKILHAKAAGCIPIYWGDPEVGRDFDVKGFLNAQTCKSPEELIQLVKSVDCDDEKYSKMMSVPALDDYRRDLVRRRFSEIAKRMLLFATGKDYSKEIPRFVGATTTEEAEALKAGRCETVDAIKVVKEDIQQTKPTVVPISSSANVYDSCVVATFATKNFWESLCQWLDIYHKHRSAVPLLRVHVFLGNDIEPVSVNFLKESYPYVVFEYIPKDSVEGFSDIWSPQHFAWKLWVYNRLVNIPEYKDAVIWYTDAGSVQLRWPIEYMNVVREYGVAVLEDSRQYNDQWCNTKCREIMKITEDELKKNQIVGGLMGFVGGDSRAVAFFEEAWKYGMIRDCIVGEKWAGLLADGRPHGHRHDQSILSVLSLRHKLPRVPLDSVYGDSSMRRTFKSGASIYVHRGKFSVHNNFTDRISEVRMINLDRRTDRMKKFQETHNWANHVIRDSACDGKSLVLTPSLARLLAPNDFFWKKAIAGCALSHLKLWVELATEQPFIENYLILEDDVRFVDGWIPNVWKKASECIPEDYDILYLGGVLPPNREMFYSILEKVNDCWSRVSENQVFGQSAPSRYFHFCNYAYIIKREAAIKILRDIMEKGGYTTSADHMICNKVNMLKHYVLMPQVAGCYQDDDPKYQTSAFNDFNRVDKFDSDLWNNDERFSQEEVDKFLATSPPLDLQKSITDAFPPKKIVVKIAEVENTKAVEAKVETAKVEAKAEVVASSVIINMPVSKSKKLYTVSPHNPTMSQVFEREWLSSLFGGGLDFVNTSLPLDHTPLNNCPIFFVQRPHLDIYNALFKRYERVGKPFAVLHLSDEFCTDNIDFYGFSQCKGVVRNYNRTDIPVNAKDKVLVLPLGYYKHAESPITTPWIDTPSTPFREKVWTFYGTSWKGREESMTPLKQIQPHDYKFFKDWLDAKQLGTIEYVGSLLNSIFVPCPGGQHPETFRFWEAIEHGAIPIYVRSPGDEPFIQMIDGNLSIINLPSWNHATGLMAQLINDKNKLEGYRNQLLTQWFNYKNNLKQRCETWLKALPQ